jgi:SNF2 family DNA or RNA helicase
MTSILHPQTSDYTTFNLDVDELTEDSPRYDKPINSKITLKVHQQALLKRCIDYESGSLRLKEFKSISDKVSEDDIIQTNFGIIGDRVGSGKSYVVLSLISNNIIADQHDCTIMSAGFDHVIVKLFHDKHIMKTNLLVIPHNLVTQWSQYVTEFPSLKHVVITKKNFSLFINRELDLESYDLVIVTSTYYNKFADHFSFMHPTWKFQRVIYDEADHISIPGCRQIDAKFIWFITASYGNILYPKGFCSRNIVTNEFVWYANGFQTSGFLKNFTLNLYGTMSTKLIRLLVLKNSEGFIESSIVLPKANKHIILSKTPNFINILGGLVDKNLLECLNADDIQGAISYISANKKSTEDNIVDIMINKYKKQLGNLQVKLNMIHNYEYDTDADKEEEIKRTTEKIKDTEAKIDMIKQRIRDTDVCSICYCDIENKTITVCCQNPFCFKCIHLWINKKSQCPMCKSIMKSKDDLYVVTKDGGASTSTIMDIDVDEDIDEHGCSLKNDKYKNLEVILSKRKPGSKFLIFSNFDSSFNNIYGIMNKMNIKYEHLKGNGNVIRCLIDRYKTGNVDALLVNSRHYGSGLNLENTTDIVMFHKFDSQIEKQVIGRADRMGRTQPLNIWYLVYENEKH